MRSKAQNKNSTTFAHCVVDPTKGSQQDHILVHAPKNIKKHQKYRSTSESTSTITSASTRIVLFSFLISLIRCIVRLKTLTKWEMGRSLLAIRCSLLTARCSLLVAFAL